VTVRRRRRADVQTAGFARTARRTGQDNVVDRVDRTGDSGRRARLHRGRASPWSSAWPPGHVAHASALRRAGCVIADYWPLGGRPLLALVWGGFVWWASAAPGLEASVKPGVRAAARSDPRGGGRLVDERAHPRDVIATVVDRRSAAISR